MKFSEQREATKAQPHNGTPVLPPFPIIRAAWSKAQVEAEVAKRLQMASAQTVLIVGKECAEVVSAAAMAVQVAPERAEEGAQRVCQVVGLFLNAAMCALGDMDGGNRDRGLRVLDLLTGYVQAHAREAERAASFQRFASEADRIGPAGKGPRKESSE